MAKNAFCNSALEGVVCSLRPKTDCQTKEGFGKEEMLCRPAHESSCWSKVVVSQEETSVPVCSVVWEELCKVAALTDSYQVRNILTRVFSLFVLDLDIIQKLKLFRNVIVGLEGFAPLLLAGNQNTGNQ